MKFTAPAGTLAAALARLALLLDDRPVIPALHMARLAADATGVTLTVDSLDRRATVTVIAEVVQAGETAARCAALRGLVGGLPQDQIVEIAQARGADVSVRAGRSRYIVDGLPPADLPQSAALAGATANFTLDREDLARLIVSGIDLDRRDALLSQRPLSACRR